MSGDICACHGAPGITRGGRGAALRPTVPRMDPQKATRPRAQSWLKPPPPSGARCAEKAPGRGREPGPGPGPHTQPRACCPVADTLLRQVIPRPEELGQARPACGRPSLGPAGPWRARDPTLWRGTPASVLRGPSLEPGPSAAPSGTGPVRSPSPAPTGRGTGG